MSGIPAERLNLVRGLVKTLPLKALHTLDTALSLSKDAKMGKVREIVQLELEMRHVRDAVFDPYLPMFRARADGLDSEVFPNWLLNGLWAQLDRQQFELCSEARVALRGLRDGDPTPVVFFRLVTAAAAILRADPLLIAPKGHDAQDLREITEFASYLDLHRLIRQFLARLPDWMGRIDADRAASLRLLYKDACAISEDAGVRFMEVIFANLDDGAMIIKFVATVADRANDRFLAESELADFGERILSLAEERVLQLKARMTSRSKDPEASRVLGSDVAQCLTALSGLESYTELSRDGPWGARVAQAHKDIARLVEDRLNGAARTLSAALPVRAEKISGRMRKDFPNIHAVVDPAIMTTVIDALRFIRDIKNTAAAGGYASLHSRTLQELEQVLDAYLGDLLDAVNSETNIDADAYMTAFERVTDLIEALCGDERVAMARRRVASSNVLSPPKSVA